MNSYTYLYSAGSFYPRLLGWLLSIGVSGEFMTSDIAVEQLETKIPWITVTFLALASATIASFHLRQRQHKIAILLILPITILLSATLASGLG